MADEPRYNQAYLEALLKFLDKANLYEAIEAYEETAQSPMGDDWLIAELGREDLFFLISQLLRRPDIADPWLYARCREVEAAPDDHIDLWAREHYKSTIITFGLSVQDILRDPETTIGIFSHSRPIAKTFLRQIKTEFESNTDLKALYPDVLWRNPQRDAPKWSEDDGIVVRRSSNTKESTVEAWGLVDGQPTGKHFRQLVYDDVVTRDSVNTPEMMAKTTAALEMSYALGVDGGTRRFVGTRYHFNDSYRTLLQRGTAKLRLYDGTKGNSGDIKQPALLTPEAMAKKRRDMGIYTFGSQILQNPKADATHGFQDGWLEYWTPDNGVGLNVYLMRDAANSKKTYADYTTDWVVGLGPDENAYVLEVRRDRLNLTERTKQMFELHQKWKPMEVRYEEYGLQADIEHIKSEMERRKYRFRIIKVGGTVRKEERIKRLIPMFENHRIILPRSFHITTTDGETKDMVQEFVENEYKAFPVSVHDDMLDSLARLLEPTAVGGEVLTLKFPSAQSKLPVVAGYGVMDRTVGL